MTSEEKNIFSRRIAQASKTELIVIMYEIAVNYLRTAIEKKGAEDIKSFRENINRARRVVNELTSVLDMKYELSYELANIYTFINRSMIKVSVSLDITEVEAAIRMLEQLKEAFEIVAKSDTSGPMMQNAQKVYAGLTYGKATLNETQDSESNRGYLA